MGDDDDGEDVATNSEIDVVDHQVDQQGDIITAALGVDHQVDHHVEHLVDLNKAALGVDHHGLEDRLLGRQRWGSLVASLSPVLK